jgi:hypothetical protein
MITDIQERFDGYHARYTDRLGNVCNVQGTWALGAALSWYDRHGNYMVICGHDQRRLVPTAAACKHPPERLHSWTAADGVVCVGCCECGALLAGALPA